MPAPNLTRNQKIAGGSLAALLLVATPLVAGWEGKSNKPYADKLANGLMTVCFGETRVEMRTYSDKECEAMLQSGISDFAVAVAKRNPELVDHPHQWAAATSLAYNVGVGSYNRSTVAKRFSAGRWREACEGFLAWSYAGGRRVKGLFNRRNAERQVCLTGLPS